MKSTMSTPLLDALKAFCAAVAPPGGDGGPAWTVERTVGVWSLGCTALGAALRTVREQPVDSPVLPLALKEIALFAALNDVSTLTLIAVRLVDAEGGAKVVQHRCAAAAKMLHAFGATPRGLSALAACAGSVDAHVWRTQLYNTVLLWSELLCLRNMDPRLVDRGAPWVYASLFLLDRAQAGGGAQDEGPSPRELLATLTSSLPRNVSAAALLQPASERLLPDAPPACLPPWLALAAGAELAKVAMLGRGVEGVLDALFSSISLDSPVAVERAQLQAASILARPPLEVAAPESYYSCVAPQLRALLRLRGGNAHLLSSTAALTMVSALVQHTVGSGHSADHDSSLHSRVHSAVWTHVVEPLLRPLRLFSQPGDGGAAKTTMSHVTVQASEEVEGLDAGRRVVLASEEDVLGCVEDVHQVATAGLLHPGAAVSLLPCSSALLHLLVNSSRSKLRVGFGTACRELLVAVLSAAPPGDAVGAILAAAQDEGDGRSGRHPSCAFILGPSAGFQLSCWGDRAVRPDGSLVEDVRRPFELHLPHACAPASFDTPLSGLGGLLNVLSGARGGVSNGVTDREGQRDPMAKAEGLQGSVGQATPESLHSADRVNALVDVLVGLKGPAGLLPGAVFSRLLEKMLVRGGEGGEREDGGSPALSLSESQLLTALTERLGPALLRSNLIIAQTLVRVLSFAVSRLGLPIPSPRDAGCDGQAAAMHESVMAGLTAAGNSAGASRSALPDAEVRRLMELVSTCLGLLTVVLGGPEFGLGDIDVGVEEEEEDGHVGERGQRDEAELVVLWMRSAVPLLAALSSVSGQGSGAPPVAPLSSSGTFLSGEGGADAGGREGEEERATGKALAEMAAALRAMILTSAVPGSARRGVSGASPSPTTASPLGLPRMRRAMALVLDPMPAIQANGLLALARLVQSKPVDLEAGGEGGGHTLPPALAGVLDLAYRNLGNSDTYVVLAAVEALAAMATTHPVPTLPVLLRLYSDEGAGSDGVRSRVKLGEALFQCARRTGAARSLPAYASALLACLMKVGVTGWQRQQALEAELLRLAAQGGAGPGFHALATPPRPAAPAYNVALCLMDLADLRASALAGLGETLAYLGHAVARVAVDVVGGLAGVLSLEKPERREGGRGGAVRLLVARSGGAAVEDESEDAESVVREARAKVRRAAAFALSRLVTGDPVRMAGTDVLAILAAAGGPLRDVYRCLQGSADAGPGGEDDVLVRGHARDALAAVDDRMGALVERAVGPLGGVVSVQGPALGGGVPKLSYTRSIERTL